MLQNHTKISQKNSAQGIGEGLQILHNGLQILHNGGFAALTHPDNSIILDGISLRRERFAKMMQDGE